MKYEVWWREYLHGAAVVRSFAFELPYRDAIFCVNAWRRSDAEDGRMAEYWLVPK